MKLTTGDTEEAQRTQKKNARFNFNNAACY